MAVDAHSALVLLEILVERGLIYEVCECGCMRHHHEGRRCKVCDNFCTYEITWRPSTPVRELLSREVPGG